MSHTTNHPTPNALPVRPAYTPAQLDRLRDQAMERAHALRAEAIIDFWDGAGALWGDAVDRTRRAADRLAARLHQHAKRRAAAGC